MNAAIIVISIIGGLILFLGTAGVFVAIGGSRRLAPEEYDI